jgi:hypothetical protein
VRKYFNLASFVEAVVKTASGILIALLATEFVCWLHNIQITRVENLTITLWMSAVSLVENYIVRVLFAAHWR